MFVKIIKSYRDIVAICDSDLLGKVFEEGKFQLEVKESFYRGDELSGEETSAIINKMVREDATFNIVGKESISLALKHGLIKEEGIKEIQGIPFAMVLM
ncbi:MAG: DUF424 family protein [Nanoarchaeota archaeon]|nr:DUF424 family protein [Nanoarchaeota archaeon]